MEFNVRDILTIGDQKYITLSTLIDNNIKYGFMNLLDENDEPTGQYVIFYDDNFGNLKALNDEGIFNALLPKFQKNLKESINNILKG